MGLLACFVHFYQELALRYNLIFCASAEEEISGPNGIASVLPELGAIDFAIVGEPTQMQMAIAEKGLMVLDGTTSGKAGHAARNEGVNAIYKAIEDIELLCNFQFERQSALLGVVKLTISQINAGTQHNVVPDICSYVVDIRSNECYSNQEIHALLQAAVKHSVLKPRSFRLNSSRINVEHPLVQIGLAMGLSTFGSPTLSDQALMPFQSLKMGIGDSARSHTADEFIYLDELKKGMIIYRELLGKFILTKNNY